MRWSLTLGSIGGTAIRIHVTFLLFLIWLGAIYYRQGGAEAAWQGTIFVVLIFLCVLLHELGHVFAARRYGVNTRDVTLWPFGGIASMEQMPEKPAQELVVALSFPWLGKNLHGIYDREHRVSGDGNRRLPRRATDRVGPSVDGRFRGRRLPRHEDC